MSATTNSAFGDALGRITVSRVGCNGEENTLNECSRITGDDVTCVSGEAAGVVCNSKLISLYTFLYILYIFISVCNYIKTCTGSMNYKELLSCAKIVIDYMSPSLYIC